MAEKELSFLSFGYCHECDKMVNCSASVHFVYSSLDLLGEMLVFKANACMLVESPFIGTLIFLNHVYKCLSLYM